jgi:molybdopterin-guanine dinucleotide biosynthesis protein A
MGRPKSGIEYAPGVSATRQAVDVLSTVCDGVYLSVRSDQEVPEDVADVPRIDDRYVGIGPMGGILSALETDREAAWLTVACDMPFLRGSDLAMLVAGRDEGAIATSATVAVGYRDAAARPDAAMTGGRDAPGHPKAPARRPAPAHPGAPARRPAPEPLCTIWEPRAREALLAALDRGISSPRRVLAAGPVCLVELPDPMALFNANTPDERVQVATRVSGGVV